MAHPGNLDLVIVGADRADHAPVGRIDIAQPARRAEGVGVHARTDIAGDAVALPDRFVMIEQGFGRFQQELDEALPEAALFLANQRIAPDAHAVLTNVTSGMGVISIMGPRARDLLQSLTPDDLSNEGFPFATSREIELGYAIVRASRITYVGELGWELYIPTEFMLGVYDAIVAAGAVFGLKHIGYHALNSLRMEKGYRHWGHDITDEDTPLDAGLGFAVKLDKPGGFIGRDALLRQKESGLRQRLVQFLLNSPEPLLYHNEPIWQGERIAGYIRSGMYAPTLGAACGLGYVDAVDGGVVGPIGADDYEIEIAGVRHPVTASLRPMFDPTSARIKM